jgi:uncharacterized protein YbaP (TraB family)
MRIALVFVALLAVPGLAAHAAPDELLEEVQVTGEQPGPAMWKVSKDDHVLWILGTLSPLPAKMTWRSKQVEAVIARSSEVLGGSSLRADLKGSRWALLRSIPAIMRLNDNPDGSTLKQVLPPDLYTRWSAAHQLWFGKPPDAKDRSRPMFAGGTLYEHALQRSGLSNRNVVWPVIQRQAKAAKIPIRQREFTVPLKDPRGLIAEVAATPRDADIACLVATLDHIDADLPNMKRRAEAWAIGDIEALRRLPWADQQQTCLEAVLSGERLHQMYEQQKKVMTDEFLNSVGYALLGNPTSITTLPMSQLLGEQGVLAKLRATGYAVEEPQ